MGFARCGVEGNLGEILESTLKKPFSFLFFCKFEKTKVVFARFGFSWNFRLSNPRLRQALSRWLQFPYSKTELFLAANEEIFTILNNQMVKN